ncbi:Aste57867_23389 [Aphanomyces stellatus]|uniref:Aste57867_23389 protein n=1 Tax=Aphanomyces stellatus TaxID=120398 RepID=A0A485LNL6_9STRA|nr:hypothetical protein As57867_023318 [Aphanomyces stellatus]VFU00035.1 Aste57867_23389 [Aphanomyces stellatus]
MKTTAFALSVFVATTATAVDKQFDCVLNSDLFGDDFGVADRTMDVCVSDCQKRDACNALTWVATTNGRGKCYLKTLKDQSRQMTKNAPDAPYMVSCKQKIESWIDLSARVSRGGTSLKTVNQVLTLDACKQACDKTTGCTAVSYTGFQFTCELIKGAQSYALTYSKVLNMMATASFRHNYKTCIAGDGYNHSDVFNFQGTFDDCAKCIGTKANAFTWAIGSLDAISGAAPGNARGQCYCKKLAPGAFDASVLSTIPNDSIFCANY